MLAGGQGGGHGARARSQAAADGEVLLEEEGEEGALRALRLDGRAEEGVGSQHQVLPRLGGQPVGEGAGDGERRRRRRLGLDHVPPEAAVQGRDGGPQEVEAGGEVADAGGCVGAQSHTLRIAAIFSMSASTPAAVTSPPAP